MSRNSFSAKVALPYAEALLDLSKAMKLINETSGHLDFVLQSIQKSARLKGFLANPLFVPQAKKNVLSILFADKISSHVLHFLYILVDRRRIALLESIIECYLGLVCKLQLVLLAEVNTACPMTDLQKQAIQSKLKHMTNSSEIRLMEQVDPELIGGLIIKIGSKVIDMSIHGQLSQISSYLNRARL